MIYFFGMKKAPTFPVDASHLNCTKYVSYDSIF